VKNARLSARLRDHLTTTTYHGVMTMSFEDPKAANARGRARQAELAAEMQNALKHNVPALLAVLGREPTELEKMQAEMLVSLFLRARRVRDAGRDDSPLLRQAADLMRDVPFLRGPSPVAEPRAD
jgi:hypothetical protein